MREDARKADSKGRGKIVTRINVGRPRMKTGDPEKAARVSEFSLWVEVLLLPPAPDQSLPAVAALAAKEGQSAKGQKRQRGRLGNRYPIAGGSAAIRNPLDVRSAVEAR